MESRLKVLRLFKDLHRTRMKVFRDDDKALAAARWKINEEFKNNMHETSGENIQKMMKMASDVNIILRQGVVQMEHVGDKLLLRPREELLLENVPYCDSPRKKS